MAMVSKLFLALAAAAIAYPVAAAPTVGKRAPVIKPVKLVLPQAPAKEMQRVRETAPAADPEREIWRHHGVG